MRTWAFQISEHEVKSEGYDKVQIEAGLTPTAEYPGCPYCGATALTQCGRCGKLTCWKGEERATCQWCGFTSQIERVDKLNVSGGAM